MRGTLLLFTLSVNKYVFNLAEKQTHLFSMKYLALLFGVASVTKWREKQINNFSYTFCLIISRKFRERLKAMIFIKSRNTVWKFHKFSIIQILRENSAKSAILSHLDTLKFQIYEFSHFKKAVVSQTTKIQSP